MPQISKQTNKPAPKPNGQGVLDRIAPLQARTDGIKFSVYGRSKSGKTRFAATFPKPMLLIGFEDGTKSIATVKGIDFVRIRSSSEMDDVTRLLAQSGKYKSAGVDTATAMRDLSLMEILGLHEMPVQKSWGLATRDQYGQAAMQVKERLRSLFNLSEHPDIRLNVVVIAQEQNYAEESKVDADLIMPSIGSALGSRLADWLNTAVDYIGHTYIREQTAKTTQKVGNKEVAMSQATGKKEYCLRIGPDPVYMTGFRLPPGAKELPDSLVNPTFEQVAQLIKGI